MFQVPVANLHCAAVGPKRVGCQALKILMMMSMTIKMVMMMMLMMMLMTMMMFREGEEVDITCTVHASPPASVTWKKGEAKLTSSGR